MVFLDTHMVVWLFAEADRIPASVSERIDEADLFVSPMVRIELSLLAEIGRVTLPAEAFLSALHRDRWSGYRSRSRACTFLLVPRARRVHPGVGCHADRGDSSAEIRVMAAEGAGTVDAMSLAVRPG